jgi:hypothetical protein
MYDARFPFSQNQPECILYTRLFTVSSHRRSYVQGRDLKKQNKNEIATVGNVHLSMLSGKRARLLSFVQVACA